MDQSSNARSINLIRQLDQSTIDLIAAGEILQRPLNGLKELVENAIDASCCRIDVSLRRSGLKSIQVADDGCGISRDQLEVVCRRFWTSKITNIGDLDELKSFGFRGEALAALSYSSRLNILTKTKDSPCAYSANFIDSQLSGSIQPCAGNNGTIITANDLFFNNRCRLATLQEKDEMTICVDYLMKIAVHYPSIAFSLKDSDKNSMIFKTCGNNDSKSNITILYNLNLKDELISVLFDSDDPPFTCQGYVTHANFSISKYYFILFINNRLVVNDYLKRNIASVYQPYLPKSRKPFVYLSLNIDPRFLDVNIHPTKEKVRLLNESIIFDKICGFIGTLILNYSRSRSFMASSKPKIMNYQPLVENYCQLTMENIDGIKPQNNLNDDDANLSIKSSEKSYALDSKHNYFAVNPVVDSFLPRNSPKAIKIEKYCDPTIINDDLILNKRQNQDIHNKNITSLQLKDNLQDKNCNYIDEKAKDIDLTSLDELRKDLNQNFCQKAMNLLSDSTFVGTVSDTQILIQHQTSLILMDFHVCFQDFIYQSILHNFACFPKIIIEPALSIEDLILMGLELPENGYRHDQFNTQDSKILQFSLKTLSNNSQMLLDYFSIEINTQNLTICSFPKIHSEIYPPFSFLPSFLLKIVAEIDWFDEKACIKGLSQNLAEFYALPDNEIEIEERHSRISHYFQNIILNNIKDRTSEFSNFKFLPSMSLVNIFQPIIDLQSLYKIFERC